PYILFFFQAEDGIRDLYVTGVQTCALPISQLAEFTLARRAPSYRIEAAAGAAAASYAFRDPLELGRGVPARQLDERAFASAGVEIGRASCRERVWSAAGGAA